MATKKQEEYYDRMLTVVKDLVETVKVMSDRVERIELQLALLDKDKSSTH